MQGLAITVPGIFTDSSLPFLPIESMIAPGTLMSLDMATALAAGLPASGSRIQNQAWAQAKAMLGGVGDVTTLSPILNYTNNARSLVEKTAKGGLSGIVSMAVANQNGDGFSAKYPDPIKQYLIDHPTHQFYASDWRYTNRQSGTNSGDHLALRTSGSTDRFFSLGRGTVLPTAPANLLGNAVSPAGFSITSGVGFNRRAVGFTGQEGTAITAINALEMGFRVGAGGGQLGGTTTTNPSLVFYFIYFEDLTVSGRTWADVNALDDAFFTQQVQNVGGKYYGDTITAPSTLP